MKILHVITGLGLGGAETVLVRLASATAHRHEVTVVSLTGDSYYAEPLRAMGIEVVVLGMPSGRLTRSGVLLLWETLRHKKPDLVQTWMYHADLLGGVLAKFAVNAPIVWGIRNSNLDAGKVSRSTRLVVKLCALLSHFVPDKIVCCSRAACELHQRKGYSKGKFEFIPNGYDLAQYAPATPESVQTIRDELGITSDTFAMGMVARYDAQKDHETLLKALRELKEDFPGFSCLLIGAGLTSENGALRHLVAELELQGNIKLLGIRNDVSRIVSALDLHILSSAYGEAFPNAVAEAMACGVPNVVTDVGDAKYIVGNEGWLVPTRDPIALAEGIRSAMLENKGEHVAYQNRKQRCREKMVNAYSMDKMLAAFQHLWTVLSSK
ncbi:MAG: glycosyltransferase [Pseudomonadota bacterium]